MRRCAELRLHQFREKAAAFVKLIERSGLDDASVLKHHNSGRLAYGGEAVSDAGKAVLIFAPGTAVGGGDC